jgi:hypothetical protein
MVSNELKMLVDSMCKLLVSIGELIGLSDDIAAAARMELGQFMMYLSASDGKIAWEEAEMISEICELNLTPNEVANFIREKTFIRLNLNP